MFVFTILIILGVIILWFLCSSLYRPLGKFVGRIINDARDAMDDEPKNERRI